DKITGLLGSRVAEEIVFGRVSTGASNDFERATNIARRMVTEFGMSEKLGPMQFGQSGGQVFLGRDLNSEQNYSDKIAYEIDIEIQSIIRECYEKAKQIITEHREQLEAIAQALLKVETLNAKQIRYIFENGTLPPEDLADDNEEETTSSESKSSDVKINISGKDEDQVQNSDEQTSSTEEKEDDKADRQDDSEKRE